MNFWSHDGNSVPGWARNSFLSVCFLTFFMVTFRHSFSKFLNDSQATTFFHREEVGEA